MKNSLKHFREAKGLTQRELAERTGFKPQTIAAYESYPRPLPEDFAEKAGLVLGVSAKELQSEPPARMREDPIPYRITTIDVALLPNEVLAGLVKLFSGRIPETAGAEQRKYVQALTTVTQEVQRRTDAASTERARAEQLEGPGVTEPVRSVALGSRELAGHIAHRRDDPARPPSDRAVSPSGNKPKPGAGAPPKTKGASANQ